MADTSDTGESGPEEEQLEALAGPHGVVARIQGMGEFSGVTLELTVDRGGYPVLSELPTALFYTQQEVRRFIEFISRAGGRLAEGRSNSE